MRSQRGSSNSIQRSARSPLSASTAPGRSTRSRGGHTYGVNRAGPLLVCPSAPKICSTRKACGQPTDRRCSQSMSPLQTRRLYIEHARRERSSDGAHRWLGRILHFRGTEEFLPVSKQPGDGALQSKDDLSVPRSAAEPLVSLRKRHFIKTTSVLTARCEMHSSSSRRSAPGWL